MNAPPDPLSSWCAAVGTPLQALPTPCLVVDLDALERNLHTMAAHCAHAGVRLRPHAKTHKSADLARLQIAAGAVGVCVQKLSEAEALAAQGIDDLYISNQLVAPAKLHRLAGLAQRLAARGGRLAVAVDSLQGIAALGAALASGAAVLDVFVEIDVGQGRCGVPAGAAAVPLVQAVQAQPRLRFAGLQAYHGRLQHLRNVAERRAAVDEVAQRIAATRTALAAAGITVPLVTGGGTGAFAFEVASGCYGEIQAGSYLFMDAEYADNGNDPAQPMFEHSLFVLSEVISVAADHVVCDAGHKSHAVDAGLPRVEPLDGQAPLRFANGGDEHGVLHRMGEGGLPALGERVRLIPGHCDPTVNLHDWLYGVRGAWAQARVAQVLRVHARGCVY